MTAETVTDAAPGSVTASGLGWPGAAVPAAVPVAPSAPLPPTPAPAPQPAPQPAPESAPEPASESAAASADVVAAPADVPARRPWALVALCALFLVCALVGGGLASSEHGKARDRSARETDEQAALAAARTIATALNTYDYKDLDASFATVAAASTEPFKSQYSSTSAQLKDLLVHYQAKATSSIVAAGIASHAGDTVTVLLFVDQTVTNASTPQPRSDRNRLQLVLRKVHGTFLVAQAQLL